MKKLFLVVNIFLFAQACTTTPQNLYYWGEYESLVYEMYAKPGKATPAIQIDKLTEAIKLAEGKGLLPGPGMYAHLGFMYAIVNKPAQSQAAFEKELELFPESQTLIEGMLKRAAQQNKEVF